MFASEKFNNKVFMNFFLSKVKIICRMMFIIDTRLVLVFLGKGMFGRKRKYVGVY